MRPGIRSSSGAQQLDMAPLRWLSSDVQTVALANLRVALVFSPQDIKVLNGVTLLASAYDIGIRIPSWNGCIAPFRSPAPWSRHRTRFVSVPQKDRSAPIESPFP
jgi:hypothetical protein